MKTQLQNNLQKLKMIVTLILVPEQTKLTIKKCIKMLETCDDAFFEQFQEIIFLIT